MVLFSFYKINLLLILTLTVPRLGTMLKMADVKIDKAVCFQNVINTKY